MVTVHAPKKPKKDDLKRVYDICNRIFRSDRLFHDTEQLKNNPKYISIK